jgi:RHS repeat-associated protein
MLNPQAVQLVRSNLAQFAATDNFEGTIESIFGTRGGAALRQQWLNGDFSLIPEIRILSNGELGTANGAYAADLDEILVSSDFLASHEGDPQAIAGLLLEEFGHKLDRVLNGNVDSPGDEGAIFRSLVTGQSLSPEILAGLRAQDDRSVIVLDGNAVEVEKQDFVGDAGGVVTNDSIIGTAGNDTIKPGKGKDTIDGGAGNDYLEINNATDTADTTITYPNLSNGKITGGSNDSTTFQNIEQVNLRTGAGNDNINLAATTGGNYYDRNTVYAGAGDDTVVTGTDNAYSSLYGESGKDALTGGSGVDSLDGGADDDNLNGLTGNDSLNGGTGNDTLNGGDGNDVLNPGTGIDLVDGGAGNDLLEINNFTDTAATNIFYTSATNGTITGGSNNGTTFKNIELVNLRTGSGNDNINLAATTGGNYYDRNTVYAGAGDDTVVTGTDNAYSDLYGEAGNDTLTGGNGFDLLDGGAGDDSLNGLASNDSLNGGTGNDTLNAGDGNDVLNPGTGIDLVDGGAGNDYLEINNATDTAATNISYTSATNGTITGGSNSGTTFKNIELVNLRTGSGNDNINLAATTGGNYYDRNTVYAGAGDDTVVTGTDNAYSDLYGEAGNDTLTGGSGFDLLDGGAGDDTLIGVNPNNLNPNIGDRDEWTGGEGKDLFILGDATNIYFDDRNTATNGNTNYAIIKDLNLLEDKIQLKGIASDYRLELNATGTGTNIYVDKPDGEPDELIAVLENVSGLTSSSPVFVYAQANSELQFSTGNFSINENGTTVIPVVITHSQGNLGAVSVTVTPSNGTAKAPADYNSTPIVVNFANGETSKTVNIPIVNDVVQEGNETLSLTLSNPTGGAALGAQTTATLTILDDDVSVPDNAGNSLSTARDIGLLNGTQSFSDRVDAIDNNDFYRFELLKNSTFNLMIDGLTADANVELIGKDGTVITNSIASGTTAESIGQTLNAGVYYLRVYPQSGQTNYNLTVKGTPLATPFQINSVSPDQGSNAGQVTLTVKGNQFTNAAAVSIIAPDNSTRNATNVIWQDESTLVATFDLDGLGAGAYDVKVSDTAGTVQSNDIFKVDTTGQGQLDASINVTARLRPWNVGEVTVNYKNTGNTDIPTPLFSLSLLSQSGLAKFVGQNPKIFTRTILGSSSGGGGGVSSSASTIDLSTLKAADTATFYGSGNIGDPSTLSPGESGTYKIYFSPAPNLGSTVVTASGSGGGVVLGADKAVGGISFSLKVLPTANNNSNTTIDWTKLKDSSKPSNISTEAWDVIYNNFTTALGNTAASYQKNLGENSSYLGRLGEKTDDVARLLAFELQQADNALGRRVIASNIDAAAPTPGLLLTFDRVYRQSISSRFAVGDLGRGWTHNWDTIATTDTDGKVTIRSGGSIRTFEKRSDNTYRAQDGDYGTLKLQSGIYRLEEQGGLARVFQSDGKLGYVEETNGNRITLGYTGTQLTSLNHSNGDKFSLNYNPQGRISTLTDQAGRITTYAYDGTGETLLSATTPDGATNYGYEGNTAGAKAYALKQIKLPDNTSTSIDYDTQGRLIKQSLDGNGESATYTYDSTGGIIVKDGTGANAKILVNDKGQTARSEDALGRITQFSYDDTGNLTKVVAPGNTISNFTYDRQGNILGSVDPLGQRVDFSYESKFNNLATVKDQRGNITAYSYTDKGNLSSIAYVDGSTETYNYDAIGNLTISANRRGQKIDYTYDTKGQLLSKKYPDGTTATFTYDSRGNLLTAVDSDSTVSYSYDSADRLTKATQNNGRFVEYTFDAGGRRTKMVDHTGAVVNYSYDAVGKLSQLTDGNNQRIIAYTYDTAGRLSREDNGNGTYTTYTYDLAGQVTGILNYTASNVVNSKYEYTYDNLGRRSSMTTLEGTTSYGYDATGQLIAVTLPEGRKIEYAYDAAGNRTTVKDSGATTNYSTNNLNQYTQVGTDNYTYDADGNLISKTQAGKTSTYTYDVENRLTQVVTAEGTWIYEYDALGNRIASIKDGQRTNYLLDPTGLGHVVGDYSSTGDLVARYTHGIGLVSRSDSTNTNSYYDTDAIGSVVGLSGTTGTYLNRYSYLPFGEDLTKVETVANSFEYVGQFGVMDEGNGLDFMRARFYDGNLGRFTEVDPLGIKAGDTNFYRYVINQPVSLIDSQGTFPILPLLIPIAEGAAVGAITYGLTSKSPTVGGLIGSTVVGGLTGGLGFAGSLAAKLSPSIDLLQKSDRELYNRSKWN